MNSPDQPDSVGAEHGRRKRDLAVNDPADAAYHHSICPHEVPNPDRPGGVLATFLAQFSTAE
jgi:hypothetical protein